MPRGLHASGSVARDMQLSCRQKGDGNELQRILLFPSSLAACVPLSCSRVTHNSYGLRVVGGVSSRRRREHGPVRRAVVASLQAELPMHAATGRALVAVEYCMRRRSNTHRTAVRVVCTACGRFLHALSAPH